MEQLGSITARPLERVVVQPSIEYVYLCGAQSTTPSVLHTTRASHKSNMLCHKPTDSKPFGTCVSLSRTILREQTAGHHSSSTPIAACVRRGGENILVALLMGLCCRAATPMAACVRRGGKQILVWTLLLGLCCRAKCSIQEQRRHIQVDRQQQEPVNSGQPTQQPRQGLHCSSCLPTRLCDGQRRTAHTLYTIRLHISCTANRTRMH